MYELLECRRGALCGSIHNRYISNLAIEVVHVFNTLWDVQVLY